MPPFPPHLRLRIVFGKDAMLDAPDCVLCLVKHIVTQE